MNSIFFKKNKKSTMVIQELVTMALAVVVILAVTAFFLRLSGTSSSNEDAPSKTNFDELYETVKDLLKSPDNEDYRIMNYYIAKDKAVVGFDTQWDDKDFTDKILFGKFVGHGENLYRPFKCGDSACLCLYKNYLPEESDERRDNGVIECRSDGLTKEIIVFSNAGGLFEFSMESCRKPGYCYTPYSGFGVQQVYIEKKYMPKKFFPPIPEPHYIIYINKIDTTDPEDEANKKKIEIDNSRKNK